MEIFCMFLIFLFLKMKLEKSFLTSALSAIGATILLNCLGCFGAYLIKVFAYYAICICVVSVVVVCIDLFTEVDIIDKYQKEIGILFAFLSLACVILAFL